MTISEALEKLSRSTFRAPLSPQNEQKTAIFGCFYSFYDIFFGALERADREHSPI